MVAPLCSSLSSPTSDGDYDDDDQMTDGWKIECADEIRGTVLEICHNVVAKVPRIPRDRNTERVLITFSNDVTLEIMAIKDSGAEVSVIPRDVIRQAETCGGSVELLDSIVTLIFGSGSAAYDSIHAVEIKVAKDDAWDVSAANL